ncbi:MAG: GH36 C-terminal domain-containing protein, partial [Ferruginibacter sp.]|nr:GH36 C-terminal domain-containing protein [Ferruginibacter sp.]
GSVYEFRSASMGAAYWHPDAPNGGNGGKVWTENQKAAIKKAVTTYKEKLRPLIRNANLYHIFPRPDSIRWDGVQYHDPSTQNGVVYIFKPKNLVDQQIIKLKGLDPEVNYKLSFEDGSNKTTVRKGSALMRSGIVVTLKGDLASELMFIDKVKPR